MPRNTHEGERSPWSIAQFELRVLAVQNKLYLLDKLRAQT